MQEDVLKYPLNAQIVHDLQQEELSKTNSKLGKLLADSKSGYKYRELSKQKLVMYKSKIYIPHVL